ncbi:MAG: DUF11 domain-containing protein, partial [Saprospiraceae bacterium]|nr:DUF11 domain-containing protein [Saprospiraceae bacterium]
MKTKKSIMHQIKGRPASQNPFSKFKSFVLKQDYLNGLKRPMYFSLNIVFFLVLSALWGGKENTHSNLNESSVENRSPADIVETRLKKAKSEGQYLMASGDFNLDFVAAAPETYDHATGGGAFDDRTVGVSDDIVESLEGGDFACGDIVTFFTQIVVDNTQSAIDDGPQTLELDFSFLADATGQSGVALGDIVFVGTNTGPVSGGDGAGGTDSGHMDGGTTSIATLTSESLTGPLFQMGSELHGTVEVSGLDAADEIIVRIDVRLFCDPGSSPTGNLQAALMEARLIFIQGTTPVVPPEAVPGGEQTIPFKQVGNITFPDLQLIKVVNSTGPYAVGDEVEFRLEVQNTGDGSSMDVEVTDYLPCGLDYLSESHGTGVTWDEPNLIWTIDQIDPGETVNLFITATINDGSSCAAGEDPYVNTAEISASPSGDIDSEPGDGVDPDGDGGIGNVDDDDSVDPHPCDPQGDPCEDDSDDAGIVVCTISTCSAPVDVTTMDCGVSNPGDPSFTVWKGQFTVTPGTDFVSTTYYVSINGAPETTVLDLDNVVAPDACGGSVYIRIEIIDDCGVVDPCEATYLVPEDVTAPVIADIPDVNITECNQPWPAAPTTTW